MDDDWYCVRSVFDWGASREAKGHNAYEERLVLIRAHSFDEAIRLAEIEAQEYADANGVTFTEFVQAYHLFHELLENGFQSGTEVFSLLRDSTLPAGNYIDTFFDTGSEHEGDSAE